MKKYLLKLITIIIAFSIIIIPAIYVHVCTVAFTWLAAFFVYGELIEDIEL
jgi:hypothetical protein